VKLSEKIGQTFTALFQEPDTWSGVNDEDREVENVVRPCRYPARCGRM